MKSITTKNIVEVLPMKKGETLAKVKTKVSLAQIPDELTVNIDSDVLFILLNKNTGDYLGYMKVVYVESDMKYFGIMANKRTAYVEMSEFSETIQDDIYSRLISRCLHNQGSYGKFANYIQIDRDSLSSRMDKIVDKSRFREMRGNPRIFEMNIELDIAICLLLILIIL